MQHLHTLARYSNQLKTLSDISKVARSRLPRTKVVAYKNTTRARSPLLFYAVASRIHASLHPRFVRRARLFAKLFRRARANNTTATTVDARIAHSNNNTTCECMWNVHFTPGKEDDAPRIRESPIVDNTRLV